MPVKSNEPSRGRTASLFTFKIMLRMYHVLLGQHTIRCAKIVFMVFVWMLQ